MAKFGLMAIPPTEKYRLQNAVRRLNRENSMRRAKPFHWVVVISFLLMIVYMLTKLL